MRDATKKELEEFREADSKILKIIENLTINNFKELWVSDREYHRHIQRRLEKGHIKSVDDYLLKIKNSFINPDDIKWKKYKKDFKQQRDRLDRFYYRGDGFWVDIFLEDCKIVTAFEIEEKRYDEILFKGDKETFIVNIPLLEIKNDRQRVAKYNR